VADVAVIVTIVSTSEKLPPRKSQGCGSRRLIVGELGANLVAEGQGPADQAPCEASDEIGKDVSAAGLAAMPLPSVRHELAARNRDEILISRYDSPPHLAPQGSDLYAAIERAERVR